MGPALAFSSINTRVYKFGTPFGYQIVLRNLQGLDLDHHDEAIKAATGYADKKNVQPATVLAVAVREGSGDPTFPDMNPDRFSEVE
ncbi:MAG: hypothetical protein Q8M65_02055 [Rhodoglobus sp.]|nr:hypothetical protein [Rhodoglobus sp.]